MQIKMEINNADMYLMFLIISAIENGSLHHPREYFQNREKAIVPYKKKIWTTDHPPTSSDKDEHVRSIERTVATAFLLDYLSLGSCAQPPLRSTETYDISLEASERPRRPSLWKPYTPQNPELMPQTVRRELPQEARHPSFGF